MKKILLFLFVPLYFIAFGQGKTKKPITEQQWVDSVFNSLSQNQQIAQLLMIRANNSREPYFDQVATYIQDYGIGGVCYFGSGAMRQAKQNNRWQSISKVPLLTSMDAEWGLGMRLDSTISFPFQMTLGAIQNDSLIYQMGVEIGKECGRIGLHMNFAPVVDINSNPNNPVINSRSFGDNPQEVSNKGLAYLTGMQSQGILASAKHFPGHGDTDSDSHKTLPIVSHSYARLDSTELQPFKKLIDHNLSGVMIAHLYIPALETEENLASTLSKNIVSGLLQDTLGFEGLVITDALDMSGVTKYIEPGEIEVRAILAGNDLLLLSKDIPKAIQSIALALDSGRIDLNYFKSKVKKILKYKYRAGLYQVQKVKEDHLFEDLNNAKAIALNQQLFEEASILMKNKDAILPLGHSDENETAILTIGLESGAEFNRMMSQFAGFESYAIPKNPDEDLTTKTIQELKKYKTLVIALGGVSIFPANHFRISNESKELIQKLSEDHQVVFSFFGSPLAYKEFLPIDAQFSGVIIGHQDNNYAASALAQQLFGALPIRGKLPVALSETYPSGFGLDFLSVKRLSYGFPEQENMQTKKLRKIDSIVQEGIAMQAFPGCQIVVAKNGRIIYSKSFGYQTYENKEAINRFSIYDLASITKVAATTLSLMKLQEEHRFNPNASISDFVPYLKGSNKDSIRASKILTHQGKLKAWIPFYLNVLDSSNRLDSLLFSSFLDDQHTVKVADQLYIQDQYKYQIYDTILKSDLRKKEEYIYSDLGFYWFRQGIEFHTNQPLELYVDEQFYQPLELKNTAFLPLNHFEKQRIVPTENDTLFRKQVIQGYVHDPGAAMLGGVSGHAGLFSNATDLAAIFQMLLQHGFYNNQQLLDSTIIQQYTSYQYDYKKTENRRGLGFDKPYPKYDSLGPTCKSASTSSFGHSGFTGTYAWADPEYQLVYIFLSNRVYPDAGNNKISKYDFRTRIHQTIYDAIEH
ncbi:MAG: serine hydrolase [Bacteroidales bacterium]|nr:serine hydrolase [Bacteroidales bacterium]